MFRIGGELRHAIAHAGVIQEPLGEASPRRNARRGSGRPSRRGRPAPRARPCRQASRAHEGAPRRLFRSAQDRARRAPRRARPRSTRSRCAVRRHHWSSCASSFASSAFDALPRFGRRRRLGALAGDAVDPAPVHRGLQAAGEDLLAQVRRHKQLGWMIPRYISSTYSAPSGPHQRVHRRKRSSGEARNSALSYGFFPAGSSPCR